MVAEALSLGIEAVAVDAADEALAADLSLCYLSLLAQALECVDDDSENYLIS